jgi:RNA polymerase sigma-70 factor (ECF subfamily)
MDGTDWLAERFEANRTHLRAVAYRMLGSLSEADDVVQDAWFRLSRSDTSEVDNLDGWLTTVVARLSLDALRSRETRREDSLEAHVPDPIIDREDAVDPEHAALLADSVGLALLVVLDTLNPVERLAFVLHDMFGVAFDEIAPMVGRSPDAARQLASRARRRVQGAALAPDVDVRRQREVVDAFFAAARDGDLEALVRVLDSDVVLRADAGPGSPLSVVHRGAQTIASGALVRFAGEKRIAHPALVNGAAGVVVTVEGQPVSVMAFAVIDDKIVEIDTLANPKRLEQLDLRDVTSR